MHSAPPVRMSLSADSRWHAFIVICMSAAAANLAAWIGSQVSQSPTAGSVPALVSAILAGSSAWILLRRSNPGGVLTWDGAVWFWARGKVQAAPSDPLSGDVRVVIDLGTWMLVRFRPTAPPRRVVWLPVSRRYAGALWPAWRAVLFSRPAVADPITANDPP